MFGKNDIELVTDDQISELAKEIKVHPAIIESISKAESKGSGRFRDGRIKILFEKHWYYKLLNERDRREAVSKNLARKNWISPAKGGYKEQKLAKSRYKILEKAMQIDEDAALQSCSVGKYQIMLFNYKICGFESARDMWDSFLKSEKNQLIALCNFLQNKNLIPVMSQIAIEYKKNGVTDKLENLFMTIEEKYNGGGQNGAYANKMLSYFQGLHDGKWKDWKFDKTVSEPVSSKQTFWDVLTGYFKR